MEDQVLEYIRQKGTVTAGELVDNLDIPRSTLFARLDELVSQGKLIKVGNRPHVIYKLPEVDHPNPTAPAPNQETPAATEPLPENQPSTPSQPSPVIYWCKILKLDPPEVTLSFEKIRKLVPNYQSVGLNPPKPKKGSLRIPDSIWTKFFNMLVWTIALVWTMMKNCYAVLRGRSTTPMVWRQMAIVIVALVILGKLSMHVLTSFLGDPNAPQLKKEYAQTLKELESTKAVLAFTKSDLIKFQEMVKSSPSDDEIRWLKENLEQEKTSRKDLEQEKQEWKNKQWAFKEEESKRERLERKLQDAEQHSNQQAEEWQKKERGYEKKMESSKSEIRELEADLSKANQEIRQLTRQLQKEQARGKDLDGEIQGLKKQGAI